MDVPPGVVKGKMQVFSSGDTTPCRMTGVTLHSHVRYKEIYSKDLGTRSPPQSGVQGYLSHKKQLAPRVLQQAYA